MSETRSPEQRLAELFPETWTHPANINWLGLMYKFKLLGLDWRSEDQFASMLAACEKRGILKRDGDLIRRGSPS